MFEALVIQHAKGYRRVILSSVASLALPYFSTLSHKRNNFPGKFIGHKMCVLIFSTTFVWDITHSKKNSARYYHKGTYVFFQNTRYSCQILMKLEFSRHIFEKYIPNFVKIRPVEAVLFYQDGRTDGKTDRQKDMTTQSFFPILRTRLIKLNNYINYGAWGSVVVKALRY